MNFICVFATIKSRVIHSNGAKRFFMSNLFFVIWDRVRIGSKGNGIIQAKCKFVFKLTLMNSQVGNGGKVFNILKVCQCLFNRLNIHVFLLDRYRNENSYP